MKQLTKKQMDAFIKNEPWKGWTDEQIAAFQLNQEKLCIPFSRFHEAVEKTLGRPVWTHEFAKPERIKAEMDGRADTPTMEEIIGMLPAEKTIVVGV